MKVFGNMGVFDTRKMNLVSSDAGGGTGIETLDDFGSDDDSASFDDFEEDEAPKKEKLKDRIEKVKNPKKEEKEAKEETPEDATGKIPKIETLNEEGEEDEKEDKKKDEKKDAKKEGKEEEKKEGEEDNQTEEEKKEAKKLKLRMADGLYGIDSDAKVRVKIDGSFQEVPVQELINNYSGKVAYDKKFSEIGNEKKYIETEKAALAQKTEFVKSTVDTVLKHLSDPDANPLEALYYLVEKSGHDNYSVYKRMLDANLEEVENLMSMSDVERKAYFLEKKDEFRTKSEQARIAESTKAQAFNQAVQKVDSLRQAHGVSEEQYLQALDQLESEGTDTNKMTDEQVVDYASLKPHTETVQDVLEPFEDSIEDSKYSEVVRNLARQLRAKAFTKEQLIEWASKEFMDEDLKDLQARTKEVQKTSSKVDLKKPTKLEMLDFDDEEWS